MAKNALEELRLARYEHDDRLAVLESFRASADPTYDNDRTVAIVSVAHIEHSLQAAIKSHFENIDDNISNILFRGGPERDSVLGGLFALSHLARALNIFGNQTLSDINTIRKIRNTFAHSAAFMSFGSTPIRDCCSFSLVNRISGYRTPFKAPAGSSTVTYERDCFVLVAYMLCLYLGNYAKYNHSAQSNDILGHNLFS